MSADEKKSAKRTLSDADVATEHPKIGRRSSLVALGAAAVGAAAIVTVPGTAEACTDRDPQDPAGRGRGNGVTDSDRGYGADPAGCGRGGNGYAPPPRQTGYTDRDPNDPAGNGRGPRACSDSDGGPYGDPAGRGRHC